MPSIDLPVRYGRELADLDLESHERNLRYGELHWSLPVKETALVLVDCWDEFPLASFVARAGAICQTKIRPVVEACRTLGLSVVHTPSPQWAANYPDFHYAAPAAPLKESTAPEEIETTWPPPDTKGTFAVPRTGTEPRFEAWRQKVHPDGLRISRHLEPVGDDLVLSTGDELHALCHQRGIKHLLYAGFATNICVLERDYGVRAMQRRGYNILLIRDATTAVESSATVDELWATSAAVFYIEIKIGVTVTTQDLLEALNNGGSPCPV